MRTPVRIQAAFGIVFFLGIAASAFPRPVMAQTTVVSFSLSDHTVTVLTKNDDRVSTLAEAVKAKGDKLVLATNGGIFGPNYSPLGLLIRDGTEISPLNTNKGSGNFYLEPNGVFYLKGSRPYIVPTATYAANPPEPSFALQSGPLLLHEGNIHPKFNPNSKNRYTRNAIGIGSDGTIHIAYFHKPYSLYELATYFRDELKCTSALYLDGAISGVYTRSTQHNTNLPYGSIILIHRVGD